MRPLLCQNCLGLPSPNPREAPAGTMLELSQINAWQATGSASKMEEPTSSQGVGLHEVGRNVKMTGACFRIVPTLKAVCRWAVCKWVASQKACIPLP